MYSSCSTHRVPCLIFVAWKVTLSFPAPRFAVPNTVKRAGAPAAVFSLRSSIFAPDSPEGEASPASVNPPRVPLTEWRLMLEVGRG